MYKSTPSAAWCKKRLLVTSLFAAIYQTSAIAADTSAVSGEAVDDTSEQMTVTAPAPVQKAGSEHSISARELENKGANDFGSIMRYEPLISATGASGGSGNGKSGFDRGGYTGYNIRGMESNRVGIDVDGIAQPNATGRGYVGRAGLNTFGIGRDYIDPYMYGSVDIQSGATSTETANSAIGGNVSFRPKSADDYLRPGKTSAFGYRSGYDSADRSWHNGVTVAGGDEFLRGILVYSRRDGQETENNSGTVDAYPANWHSDAFLASGIWQPNDEHKLTSTFDYYHKTNPPHYDTWDSSGNSTIGTANQTSQTRRWGLSLKDDWTPMNDYLDSVSTKIYYQHTEAHDWTYMPDSVTRRMQTVNSNYDTDTWGLQTALAKTLGRHDLSAGFNASQLYGSWNLGSSYAGSQQYALIGNTDLKTETSDNLEWGLKGEVTEGITLRTALFYNSYKNFIAYTRYTRANNPGQFTNVPSNIYTIYQAENRDKAYIYGGEISTKFNFGTWFEQVDGLSATLALGYSEGKSKSSYSGDKYVDLDSVAPMKAIVGVAWDDPAKRYGTALTATFVKGKQATATNRESYSNSGSAITDASSDYMRVPGYGMLDWTAYWQVAKNVRLNGGVYNLTDRKYWDYLSSRNIETGTNQDANDKALAVMPGRTWQLGVNVDF